MNYIELQELQNKVENYESPCGCGNKKCTHWEFRSEEEFDHGIYDEEIDLFTFGISKCELDNEYYIQTKKHMGKIERLGPYEDEDELWKTVCSWPMPDDYNEIVFETKKQLVECFEESDVDVKIPDNLNFPITLYSSHQISIFDIIENRQKHSELIDENYNFSTAEKLTEKAKQFLWEAHFHDEQYARIIEA